MTAADHAMNGSTPPDELGSHPGQTLLEVWGSDKTKSFLMQEIAEARELHALALAGDETAKRFLRRALRLLGPNLVYVRKIKQLPDELQGFGLREFRVPKK